MVGRLGGKNIDSRDAMWFLVVLVIIGVVAAGYVLNEGLKDASRNRPLC